MLFVFVTIIKEVTNTQRGKKTQSLNHGAHRDSLNNPVSCNYDISREGGHAGICSGVNEIMVAMARIF